MKKSKKVEDEHERKIKAYLNQMLIIRNRMESIRKIGIKEQTTICRETNIEFMTLQIRKIIEHIAMSSLIANIDLYKEYSEKFSSNWNARYIFRDLERINPRFYPQPVELSDSNDKDTKEFNEINKNYLTKEEAIKVYNKCNALMHVSNPFGSKIDYEYYEKELVIWYGKIMNLLNQHLIVLVGEEIMYYIIMVDSENKPHGFVLEKDTNIISSR